MNSTTTIVPLASLGTESTIKALRDSGVLWTRYKSGIWNLYGEPIPTEQVFDLIRKSPYGASAYLVYDGIPKDDDSNLLYAEVTIPTHSDMY